MNNVIFGMNTYDVIKKMNMDASRKSGLVVDREASKKMKGRKTAAKVKHYNKRNMR